MIAFRENFRVINGKRYHTVGMCLFITDDFGNAVRVRYNKV